MSPATKKSRALVPVAGVEAEAARRIFVVRGHRVVLDSDLAEFYGVETRAVNRQVARNEARFPEDFSFRLTPEETANLRCQFGTASWGGRRDNPRVFTEQGALAVAGVLRSERADDVSVAVARAFVAMRDQLAELGSQPVIREFAKRLAKLEKDSSRQAEFNKLIVNAMRDFDSLIELIEGDLGEGP